MLIYSCLDDVFMFSFSSWAAPPLAAAQGQAAH